MLKEFWFPVLLGAAGLVPLFFGENMVGNGRRVMLTLAALFFFAGALSYIWGDPVRGPFTNLLNPKAPENFKFQAGVTCIYPVKRLAEGLDFTHCISMPNQPIQLWVKKTWWSGLSVRMTLLGPGNKAILIYENKEVKYLDAGFDLNHDDYALELVSATRAPLFQLIVAEDYSAIYLNAILSTPNGVIVLKDRRLEMMPLQKASLPENKLDRIFRYPSYAQKGIRE